MLKKIIYSIGVLVLISLTTIIYFLYPKKPIVSVVLPTYNRAQTLPVAIDSILAQTFQDFELIIVDDGSTDNTQTLLKKYQAKSDKIKVITHAKNKGVSAARNRGNDVAQGKYIAIMDSDDIATADFLLKSVEFMEKNPSITIGVPVRFTYWPNEGLTKKFIWPFPLHDFVFGNTFGNVGNIFKRDFIKKHNIRYKSEYTCGEDYDFWIQMILKGATTTKIPTNEPLVVTKLTGGLSQDKAICNKSNIKIQKLLYEKIGYKSNNSNSCVIIKKMLKVFPNVFGEPTKKEYINTCPQTDNAVRIKHPDWHDYIVFSDDKKRIHIYTRQREQASVTNFIPNQELTIKWDKYGIETFLYDKNSDAYILKEDKIIKK